MSSAELESGASPDQQRVLGEGEADVRLVRLEARRQGRHLAQSRGRVVQGGVRVVVVELDGELVEVQPAPGRVQRFKARAGVRRPC